MSTAYGILMACLKSHQDATKKEKKKTQTTVIVR